MNAIRYDILRRDGDWILTDGHSTARHFLTSAAALIVARAEAETREEAASIFLWRFGVPEQVFEIPAASARRPRDSAATLQ